MAQTRARPRRSTRRVLLPLLLPLALGAGLLRGTPAPVRAHTLSLPSRPVAVTIANGHAFVLAADAALWRLDRAPTLLTRVLPADHGAEFLSPGLALDPRRQRLFVADPGDGMIPSVIHLIDSRTGSVLGAVRAGRGASALAVDVRQGHLLVANAVDGTVSVFDARDGTLLRTVAVGGLQTALALDARWGRVYVANAEAGTLSLLDAVSGALLRTVRVDPTPSVVYALPYALAVDEARDRVYLSAWGPLEQGPSDLTLRGNGTLDVLDARTGKVLRRIAVGVAPQAVAVEAASGRVVVASGGGEVLPAADWAAPWIDRLHRWLPWLGRGAPRQPTTERVPGSVSLIDGAS